MRHLIYILMLVASGHGAERLDWDASPKALNVTSYQVHLGTNSRAYLLHYATTNNTLTLTNLSVGKWYAVVSAHNASQACPFWETSDRDDDAVEVSFIVSNPQRTLIILGSSSINGVYATDATVNVAIPASNRFYKLAWQPQPGPTSTVTRALSIKARSVPIAPPPSPK